MRKETHFGQTLENMNPSEVESQITAMVLGETSQAETKNLQEIIKKHPQLAAFKQQTETLHHQLIESLSQQSSTQQPPLKWQLPATHRDELLHALQSTEPTSQTSAKKSPSLQPLRKTAIIAAALSILAVSAYSLKSILPSNPKNQAHSKQAELKKIHTKEFKAILSDYSEDNSSRQNQTRNKSFAITANAKHSNTSNPYNDSTISALQDQVEKEIVSPLGASAAFGPNKNKSSDFDHRKLSINTAAITGDSPNPQQSQHHPVTSTEKKIYSVILPNHSDKSYHIARTHLLEKDQLPDPAQMREEEFINAIDYNLLTSPQNRSTKDTLHTAAKINIEQAVAPFTPQTNLIRIGIHTPPRARPSSIHIIFNPKRVLSHRRIGFANITQNTATTIKAPGKVKLDKYRNNTLPLNRHLAAQRPTNALYQVAISEDGQGDIGVIHLQMTDPTSGNPIKQQFTIPYAPSAKPFELAPPSIQMATIAAILGKKLSSPQNSHKADSAQRERLSDTIKQIRRNYPANTNVQDIIRMYEKTKTFEKSPQSIKVEK